YVALPAGEAAIALSYGLQLRLLAQHPARYPVYPQARRVQLSPTPECPRAWRANQDAALKDQSVSPGGSMPIRLECHQQRSFNLLSDGCFVESAKGCVVGEYRKLWW